MPNARSRRGDAPPSDTPRGLFPNSLMSTGTKNWGGVSRWLASLPQPVAVFACYDVLARRVIEACRDLVISVPHQMAVLGVDNDELLCRLTTPQLSSIIPDARGAGQLAAELLDRLLAGRSPPNTCSLRGALR